MLITPSSSSGMFACPLTTLSCFLCWVVLSSFVHTSCLGSRGKPLLKCSIVPVSLPQWSWHPWPSSANGWEQCLTPLRAGGQTVTVGKSSSVIGWVVMFVATPSTSWWLFSWRWQSRIPQLPNRQSLMIGIWLWSCLSDRGLLNSPGTPGLILIPFLCYANDSNAKLLDYCKFLGV